MRALALALGAVMAAAPMYSVAQDTPASADVSQVQVAVLALRGLQDERPRGVASLLAAVQRRTAVEPDVANVPHLAPADPALLDHPLAVLSGASDFPPLTDREVDALRGWLTSGGMLFVDDASGVPDSPFAKRVRAEMSRVLGGRAFEPLPSDHAAFRSFYLMDRAWGRVDVSDRLEAIRVSGRAAVVLSQDDILGACERDAMGEWAHPVDPGGTRQRELAIRLGTNLVLYALTLDYKEDLVHLPLILQRKR